MKNKIIFKIERQLMMGISIFKKTCGFREKPFSGHIFSYLICITAFILSMQLLFSETIPETTIKQYDNTALKYLKSPLAVYGIDMANGSLCGVWRADNNTQIADGSKNYYNAMCKSGDITASEKEDIVTASNEKDGMLVLTCRNPKLKTLKIVKKYRIDGIYLRRELIFHNTGNETIFLTPSTEMIFKSDFHQDSYYLGSGYVGPLIPAPKITQPQKEIRYKQTSKGMTLCNDAEKGSFSHYRTKLNGKFVFPFWQSAISSYIEAPNYLYYTPLGWNMSLGTVDIIAGKSFSIEDCFVFFRGNWHEFLNRIYTEDCFVSNELDTIKAGPEWLNNVVLYVGYSGMTQLKQILEMVDDGEVMVLVDRLGNWGDYRVKEGVSGQKGGYISGLEFKKFTSELKSISPRLKLGIYNWVSSVLINTPLFKEHPEMFMIKDRNGADKNLFPGTYVQNYPTMINRPAAAVQMLNMFRGIIDYLNVDFIYLDEPKTTNLIDWTHGDLMRDDHWYSFWKQMNVLGREKNVVMFGNGRGNPYFDLNFIEARHQLLPSFWKEFAGMALSLESIVDHRQGGRLCLLYWNPGCDYITRVMAQGWIPAMHGMDYNKIPFIFASSEIGNATNINAKYSPDWKKDSNTQLETYCTKRQYGGDIIFSLINRSKDNNADVNIDLKSLGIPLEKKVYIWEYRVDKCVYNLPNTYVLGGKERRENYRLHRWREGLAVEPKLVYSGALMENFKHTFTELEDGTFRQLVITTVPAGIYSKNDLPLNYFFTADKDLLVSGNDFPVQVESKAESAELILFSDKDNVTVNGKTVPVEWSEFSGKLYPVVKVSKGISKIDLNGTAKKIVPAKFNAVLDNNQIRINSASTGGLYTISSGNKLLYCGTVLNGIYSLPRYHNAMDLQIKNAVYESENIVSMKIPCGESSAAMLIQDDKKQPSVKNIVDVNKNVKNIKLLAYATETSEWTNSVGIQRDMSPFVASADPDKLCLTAGTSNKIEDFQGHAYAGFKLSGAKKIQIRMDNTFTDAGGIFRMHVNRYKKSPLEFAGIVIDYQTSGKPYRVALSVGVRSLNGTPKFPSWNTAIPANRIFDLGNMVDEKASHTFSIDLKSYAPANWNGTAWFSIGTSMVCPGRRLTATLEAFNNAATAPVVSGNDVATIKKEYAAPRSLKLNKVNGTTFEEVWKIGAVVPNFFLLGGNAYPRYQSEARIAYDNHNLYISAKLLDSRNSRILDDFDFEIWVAPVPKKVFQIRINSAGEYDIMLNSKNFPSDGFSVRTNFVPGKFTDYFVTIPFDIIGKPGTGTWKLNLCRVRSADVAHGMELSTWGPLVKRFNEPENFGNIYFEDRISNLGKGGASSGDILKYQLKQAIQLKPDIAIVLAGTNDMINSGKLSSYDNYEKNMRSIVNALKKSGSAVILVTIPPCEERILFMRHKPELFGDETPNKRILNANKIIEKIAEEEKIPLADFFSLVKKKGMGETKTSLIKNMANSGTMDGVHPTAEGYLMLAEIISQIISENKLPWKKIVCIGDSITYGASMKGAGTATGDTYPAKLSEFLIKK